MRLKRDVCRLFLTVNNFDDDCGLMINLTYDSSFLWFFVVDRDRRLRECEGEIIIINPTN